MSVSTILYYTVEEKTKSFYILQWSIFSLKSAFFNKIKASLLKIIYVKDNIFQR